MGVLGHSKTPSSTSQLSLPDSAVEDMNSSAADSPRLSMADVRKHNSMEDCWIVCRGKVYNVTDFANDHPGGAELIYRYAGERVDEAMQDSALHYHSEGAYDILDDYYLIGKLADDDHAANNGAAEQATSQSQLQPFLDLDKPLIWQMFTSSYSKEYYLTQVHLPRHLPRVARFFAHPLLEPFTRTPWYMVPLVWLPVSIYFAMQALEVLTPWQALANWLVGLFIWSISEYTFHRFLFHVDDLLPDHPYALTLHFLLHGVHHFLPMDRMRLVFPPILFAVLVTGPYVTMRSLCGYYPSAAMLVGVLHAYVTYDTMHYYLHHGRALSDYLRDMKSYHLAHHYKNADLGFGITSKIWDYAFGTVLDMSAKNGRGSVESMMSTSATSKKSQ
ncbi:fatty acid alpha-hydroxylase [Sorochytrium milnesiophthora]